MRRYTINQINVGAMGIGVMIGLVTNIAVIEDNPIINAIFWAIAGLIVSNCVAEFGLRQRQRHLFFSRGILPVTMSLDCDTTSRAAPAA